MMQATALLGLRAVAPIHAGSDDARGAVDLPIQREKHNNWPVVFASSVKGALREACSKRASGQIDVAALFGLADKEDPDKATQDKAEQNKAEQNKTDKNRPGMQAGALLVSDMQLLALPVASLDQAFRWVTCPGALARLARCWARFGMAPSACPELATGLKPDRAYHFDDGLPAGKNLFLREYCFTAERADASLAPWLGLLAHLFGPHTAEEELRKRLVIVSDAHFSFLAESATSVAPHIKLNENKTTVDGAMFFEETLPPETLMFLPLACVDERKTDAAQTGPQLMAQLLACFAGGRQFLRVGGNETTGMGWFELHVCKGQS
jgi:CRISPR-associated protein Cmr4